jgi:hypothetical protein
VERGWTPDRPAHSLGVGNDPGRVQMAEPLPQLEWCAPRALEPDPLIEDHTEQEREAVRPNQFVRSGIGSYRDQPTARKTLAQGEKRSNNVLRLAGGGSAVNR